MTLIATTFDDQMSRILLNEVLLPSQTQQLPAFTPEKKLTLAILEDAVHQFFCMRKLQGVRAERITAEVLRWFQSRECEPFTFEFCCQVLGFDAEGVRKRIVSKMPESIPSPPASIEKHHLRLSRERRTKYATWKMRRAVRVLQLQGLNHGAIGQRLGISRDLVVYCLHSHDAKGRIL